MVELWINDNLKISSPFSRGIINAKYAKDHPKSAKSRFLKKYHSMIHIEGTERIYL